MWLVYVCTHACVGQKTNEKLVDVSFILFFCHEDPSFVMRILPGELRSSGLETTPWPTESSHQPKTHFRSSFLFWMGRDSQGWTSVEKLEAAGDCGVGGVVVVVMKLLSSLVRHTVGCWGYSAEPNIHMCSDNTSLYPSIYPSVCLSVWTRT